MTSATPRSLDSETKKQVKNWVLALRKLLEEDLGREMKRLGLERGEVPVPLSKLDYLTGEERAIRRHLEALLARETKMEGTRERGYDAVRREMAYTFLNRLVGLRCMEARGLLVVDGDVTEVVTTRPEYGGLSRLLRDLRASGGPKYKWGEDAEAQLVRDGLAQAFAAVTEDIKVLFDPDHEYSRLWPSFPTLKKVTQQINEGLPPEAFASPDFLGWVYQFFNVEEKERVRERTKGKPTTPYELAVINQFYTPDWIVKFLVDNTLGRVWLQMHPDTRLHHPVEDSGGPLITFDYLVPRTGEDRRQQVRPVRDLRLLDPACGTMHFGQYAFALLYEMYLEEMQRAGHDGWPATPSVASPEDIAASILEHNLFGIDIDARAIQIAALALLLTAKELAKAHGLAATSVHVRKMNLVLASAVGAGEEQLTRFLERANGRIGDKSLRRQLIDAIWKNLRHVSELGSLIQITEEVEVTIRGWVERGGAMFRQHDRDQAQRLKGSLLEALHAYAADRSAADTIQRLFAEDTARGFQLLDFLSLRYDAIVMNPPYGAFIGRTKDYVKAAYPRTSNDIYAAFIERGAQLLSPGGYLGALVSATFANLQTFESLRTEILLRDRPLLAMLDLGFGILDDATVEAAAIVLASMPGGAPDPSVRRSARDQIAFFELVGFRPGGDRRIDERHDQFVRMLRSDSSSSSGRLDVPRSAFASIEGAPLAYRNVALLTKLFGCGAKLGDRWADVQGGMNATESARFLRYRWEPGAKSSRRWMTYSKGGAFSRFYSDLELVIDWTGDGREYKRVVANKYGSASRFVKSEDYYGRPGLTWTEMTNKGLSVRRLPAGAIFNCKGPCAFPKREIDEPYLLGIMNSSVAQALMQSLTNRSYGSTYVAKLPIPDPEASLKDDIKRIATALHEGKAIWDSRNETSSRFSEPWLLRPDVSEAAASLPARLDAVLKVEADEESRLRGLYGELEALACRAYGITETEREALAQGVGDRRRAGRPSTPEVLWAAMEGKSAEQKRMEHVIRLLSFCVKRIVERDDDGIVPLVACNNEPLLEDRVLAELATLVGEDGAHLLEGELASELRKKVPGYRRAESVGDFLANAYFEHHVRLYKSRPIFWHLASAGEGGGTPAFAVLVHYHRFTKDALRKLRGTHVRSFIERRERDLALARKANRTDEALEIQRDIEEAQAFDKRLQGLEEGRFPIRVPWKSAAEQPKGWDPDIDDGVKLNILPLQTAGLLRIARVVSTKGGEDDE